MGGCKAPITTFIVEPFVPHDQEYYLSIVSERLGCTISFSECGGIEIEENWDKVGIEFSLTSFQYLNYSFSSGIWVVNFICFVFIQVKTIFLPTEKPFTLEACAPLIATLPLEVSFIYNCYGVQFSIFKTFVAFCLSKSCVDDYEHKKERASQDRSEWSPLIYFIRDQLLSLSIFCWKLTIFMNWRSYLLQHNAEKKKIHSRLRVSRKPLRTTKIMVFQMFFSLG